MSDDERDQGARHVRLTVEVRRRPPTAEELARFEEAVRKLGGDQGPYDVVWETRVVEGDPPADLDHWQAWSRGSEDEQLDRLLADVRERVSTSLSRALTGRQVPVDPRFAELIGTGRVPTRDELVRPVADLMGIREPTTQPGRDLVVEIALLANGWYVNPYADTESTTAGNKIVGTALHGMGKEAVRAAFDDLGVKGDDALWGPAATLLRRMGFDMW